MEIWELAIIPALMNNSDVWFVDENIFKVLEDFQSCLVRGLLRIPKSCPIPALTYESNLMQMKYRVYARKLNLVKHILCQDETSNLSKQIISEQIANDWPGLYKEAQVISDELKLSGLNDPHIGKNQFKIAVKKACKYKNEDDLISKIGSYKKMSALRDENTKGNDYFFKETLHNVRTIFCFQVDLYEAKLNNKNKPENKRGNFLCKFL